MHRIYFSLNENSNLEYILYGCLYNSSVFLRSGKNEGGLCPKPKADLHAALLVQQIGNGTLYQYGRSVGCYHIGRLNMEHHKPMIAWLRMSLAFNKQILDTGQLLVL